MTNEKTISADPTAITNLVRELKTQGDYERSNCGKIVTVALLREAASALIAQSDRVRVLEDALFDIQQLAAAEDESAEWATFEAIIKITGGALAGREYYIQQARTALAGKEG